MTQACSVLIKSARGMACDRPDESAAQQPLPVTSNGQGMALMLIASALGCVCLRALPAAMRSQHPIPVWRDCMHAHAMRTPPSYTLPTQDLQMLQI
jgi:hypothetical protein